MTPRRVVVVGYGMAGARFADEVRRRDPGGERVALTVVGAEPHPAYNRVLLSAVLAGSIPASLVGLHGPEWAAETGVDLRVGVSVESVDRVGRTVSLSDGSTVEYDSLVLATGSCAWVPPVDGLVAENGSLAPDVATFRDLDDCTAIIDRVRPGAPITVLGGGLLGLEAARGLLGRGCLVTVVHPVGHLMERQLDPAAGGVLAKTLAGLGIDIRLGRSAAQHVSGDGLKLDDGSHVPAELVVVAAGTRAEVGVAESIGLSVRGGIVVDDLLRTSDPRIHAIGDCAAHPGTVAGLVQPAWDQAVVLADLLTGTNPAARYRATPPVTRLKARGIDLAALGETHAEDAEVITLHDPTRDRYAKLVLREDRVAGAIVLGFPDAAAAITEFFDTGAPAPTDRLALLLGRANPGGAQSGTPDRLPDDALVCRCNTVTKARLVQAWRDGATDVPALVAATRATTGCGTCTDTTRAVADWLATTSPEGP
ncbi:assimilatory nitrate reductase electron transfer subunit [Actinokineospora baliensis]|uniref:FAD-dependent oxidoreductase n=1 Tax=Actinokineospora baliensis TaxID=547056 RepID=UPI00195AA1CF|nr:FAD-dependent oxidoreductase [Actinokineospora baliensis]MBM7772110.1 assimilatory nitrate reductase electron transfer subunit [Actinokineospora baliensis]